MARKDGTGPMGDGPMTGRGFGPCNGENTDSYGSGPSRGLGRGFNRGMRCGGGMGFFGRRSVGGSFPRNYSTKTDKEALTEEKGWLENRLSAIAQQLSNLTEDNK